MRFDRGKFNRRDGAASVWLAEVRSRFWLSSPALRAVSRLQPQAIHMRAAVAGRLKGLLNAQGAVHVCFQVMGRVTLVARMTPRPIQSAFGGNRPALRSTAYSYIDLGDLVLMPGETLIIDTEELTIRRDSENALEFWQPGSAFFQLGAGENTLYYFDLNGDTPRRAHITVTWRDRWL